MKEFKEGNIYFMVSPCNTNAKWFYCVTKRTKKTVKLRNTDGEEKTYRIQVWNNEEVCKPLGNYSMSPTLHASNLYL